MSCKVLWISTNLKRKIMSNFPIFYMDTGCLGYKHREMQETWSIVSIFSTDLALQLRVNTYQSKVACIAILEKSILITWLVGSVKQSRMIVMKDSLAPGWTTDSLESVSQSNNILLFLRDKTTKKRCKDSWRISKRA